MQFDVLGEVVRTIWKVIIKILIIPIVIIGCIGYLYYCSLS